MKNFFILLLIVLLSSCKDSKQSKPEQTMDAAMHSNADIAQLETNFHEWWVYHSTNIVLSSEFVAYNDQSETISKNAFLESLMTGDYIALKLDSKEEMDHYKLYRLDQSADKSIRRTVKNTTLNAYKRFKMEGTPFPSFHFTDLKGNEYTNESTKGKNMIVKCWFIGCKPCIAEFPELNELVDSYKDREDYIFVSLAIDSKPNLEKFLSKKPFNYETVSNQKEYMEGDLEVRAYPTHFVINQEGTIEKVVTTADELISFLDSGEITPRKVAQKIVPPPPPAAQ